LELIDAILDTINPFLARLADDSSFRSGCLWGLFIALFIGLVSRQLLYWWNRVLQFFRPTKKPATDPGPSPSKTYAGAVFSFLALVSVLVFTFLLMGRYLGLI
jgi:hypothetical protein